jgi:hypothetical protein
LLGNNALNSLLNLSTDHSFHLIIFSNSSCENSPFSHSNSVISFLLNHENFLSKLANLVALAVLVIVLIAVEYICAIGHHELAIFATSSHNCLPYIQFSKA